MAVVKKDGKWYIHGKIKKDDGTYYNYHKLARGCRIKKETEEYERLFKLRYQDIQVSSNNKTFKDIAVEMLNEESRIKGSSRIVYKERLGKVYPIIGNKKINLITKDFLQQNVIREFEKQYSEAYVAAISSAMNKVFEYAISKEYIQVNPLTKVRRKIDKDTIKEEKHFWEPAQFDRFIKEVDNQELRAFYVFSFWMGTRRGETLALQWKDIDFDSNTVSIRKTVTRRVEGKVWALTTPKTKNSIRNITMPEIVVSELHSLYQKHSKMYGFNQAVFLFGYYRPMPDDYPRRYLLKTLSIINETSQEPLTKITIHEFRHSHASYLINNMSDQFTVYDIAKRLGDTVETVLSTYAHQFKNADKKLSDFIDKDISKNPSIETAKPHEKYTDLIELKQLLDAGIITQDDFDIKKKQILGI